MSLNVRDKGAFHFVGAIHESPAQKGHQTRIILIAAQIIVFIAIGVLLWQIWCKFKSIPNDEIVGEERVRYMTQRLTRIGICAGLEAMLQIAAAILRLVEAI